MPKTDLTAAIRSVVAHEIAAALAPYQPLLDRMSKFLESAPARRGPGRPPKSAGKVAAPIAPVRRRRRRGSVAKAATRAASKLSVGQKVSYNVGRGTFEGKVVAIDAKKGAVTLESLTDGKKVTRPVGKVKAG